MWVFASLWDSRPLCGSWTSPTHSPLPNRHFPSLVHHPWASNCQLSTFFYPLWEPCTSLLSSTIGNNIPLLGIFQDRLWGLYRLAWCNILFLLQLWKGPALLHLQKGFKYTYLVLVITAKGTSIILPPLSHTIMGSDTICWRDKHLEELS